jgi:hypothetical protein
MSVTLGLSPKDDKQAQKSKQSRVDNGASFREVAPKVHHFAIDAYLAQHQPLPPIQNLKSKIQN